MPLVIAVTSAAALRRPEPFRFLQPPRNLSLTMARCAPSPPPTAEVQPAKPPQPRRYPRQYPGEAAGVAEEMRFVAMRLRNPKRTTLKDKTAAEDDDEVKQEEGNDEMEVEEEEDSEEVEEEGDGGGEVDEEWMPSMEGFVKYLVDSKLIFDTIERIVAESTDVA